ncbi:hypothetical protein F4777DRAFT_598563 [Nemania sp. FL0916]|nr:hypothetical protein F4777DRAFT_598563 [Nemania sp. FL0916]
MNPDQGNGPNRPTPIAGLQFGSQPGQGSYSNRDLTQDEHYRNAFQRANEAAGGSSGDPDAMMVDDPDDPPPPDMGGPPQNMRGRGQSSADTAAGSVSHNIGSDGLGTFGVELEFLMVQCARLTLAADGRLVARDPHSDEPGWISSRMPVWERRNLRADLLRGSINNFAGPNGTFSDPLDDDLEKKRWRYSRVKLARVLRNQGLVVIKWPEEDFGFEDDAYVAIPDFSESDDSDDEREEDFPNSNLLDRFRSTYTYDPSLDGETNGRAIMPKWQADYDNFHATNGLRIYRTRDNDIDSLINRCTAVGFPATASNRLRLTREAFKTRLTEQRDEAKQAREDDRNAQIDPLHVPVPGLSPQYKAWTVTVDISVDGNGMNVDRYANPANLDDPYAQYHWFGAEVVSPVFALGDERARQAIRIACGSLRDALRCHKPMEVSTGLHIHLGHTLGWTLYQAKRFATFWLLTEMTILALHRRDRDADAKWCAKIWGGSSLWRALYSTNPQHHTTYAGRVPNNNPPDQKQTYADEMAANVSRNANMPDQYRELIYLIWQYPSITALHQGLGESTLVRTGIKWQIRGVNSSLERPAANDPSASQPGTIEVRIMQGTLDADHINNWVAVLEKVCHAVRDLSDNDFRQLLDQFLNSPTRDGLLQVLGVSDSVRQYWRDRKRRDAMDRYWEYPDHDMVDWNQPFMVPGYKATHGAFWD